MSNQDRRLFVSLENDSYLRALCVLKHCFILHQNPVESRPTDFCKKWMALHLILQNRYVPQRLLIYGMFANLCII